MDMETYFKDLSVKEQENIEYFGRPLTRWQRFRNWIAGKLGMKKPFRLPYEWSPDELAAIASRREYDRACLDIDPTKMEVRGINSWMQNNVWGARPSDPKKPMTEDTEVHVLMGSFRFPYLHCGAQYLSEIWNVDVKRLRAIPDGAYKLGDILKMLEGA